jgi:hypothetical protein
MLAPHPKRFLFVAMSLVCLGYLGSSMSVGIYPVAGACSVSLDDVIGAPECPRLGRTSTEIAQGTEGGGSGASRADGQGKEGGGVGAAAGTAGGVRKLAEAPKSKGQATRDSHPAVREAVRALEAAKKELQSAPTDLGGHREKAVKAVDQAMQELKAVLKLE